MNIWKIVIFISFVFIINVFNEVSAGTEVNDGTTEITLAWDKNPEDTVVGYKLYYRLGSSGPPWDGKGAKEGDSPIDVKNVTTFKVTGLDDSKPLFFVVTAYDKNGFESGYSGGVAQFPKVGKEFSEKINNSIYSISKDVDALKSLISTKDPIEILQIARIREEISARSEFEKKINDKISEIRSSHDKLNSRLDTLIFWILALLVSIVAGMIGLIIFFIKKTSPILGKILSEQ